MLMQLLAPSAPPSAGSETLKPIEEFAQIGGHGIKRKRIHYPRISQADFPPLADLFTQEAESLLPRHDFHSRLDL